MNDNSSGNKKMLYSGNSLDKSDRVFPDVDQTPQSSCGFIELWGWIRKLESQNQNHQSFECMGFMPGAFYGVCSGKPTKNLTDLKKDTAIDRHVYINNNHEAIDTR